MSELNHRQPSKLAPGMTMPIVAGQQYTLTDVNGEAAVLEGRDDPLTLDFISAYDEWQLVQRSGVEAQVQRARVRLEQAFHALPRRIIDTLPSNRSGIVIPGRS